MLTYRGRFENCVMVFCLHPHGLGSMGLNPIQKHANLHTRSSKLHYGTSSPHNGLGSLRLAMGVKPVIVFYVWFYHVMQFVIAVRDWFKCLVIQGMMGFHVFFIKHTKGEVMEVRWGKLRNLSGIYELTYLSTNLLIWCCF